MDAFTIDLLVLFLGIIVAALAVLTFYFVRKRQNAGKGGGKPEQSPAKDEEKHRYFPSQEDKARKKTKQLIESYIKEKSKLQKSMNKELEHLDALLESKQIDKQTYERLKNVLVMMNDKKRGDAKDLLEYVTSND